jgi:hypothetical protein
MSGSRIYKAIGKVRIAVEQSSAHQLVSALSDTIASRSGDPGNEAMGTQDEELSSDPGGKTLSQQRVIRDTSIQLSQDMGITESTDEVFTSKDCAEQHAVFNAEGIEAAMAGCAQAGGSADSRTLGVGIRGILDRGEGVKITPVCAERDLSIPMKKPHALGKGSPGFDASSIAFADETTDTEDGGMVDDGLDAKDRAELVIHLDPVSLDAMFDPDPPATDTAFIENLPLEEPVKLTTEESQDVLGGEAQRAVFHQFRIQAVEGFGGIENDIGSQFALIGNPVIGELPEKVLEEGIGTPGKPIKNLHPVAFDEAVSKTLGSVEVIDGKERVFGTCVSDTVTVHLPGEYLVTVDADLDEKWEPCLQADVKPSELGIDEVEVQMEATARAGGEAEAVPGLAKVEGSACFGGAKDADETLSDAVLLGNPMRVFFLSSKAVEVHARTFCTSCKLLGCRTDAVGLFLDEGAELLQGDSLASKKPLQPLGVIDGQMAVKDQPVEAAQRSLDLVRMACYEFVHGVLLLLGPSAYHAGGGERLLFCLVAAMLP